MAKFEIPELSPEAYELLLEAVRDPEGQIMKVAHSDGVIIRTNGREFVEEGSARSRAAWEGAFNELLDEQLVEDIKGHVFQVTDRGYNAADRLTP